VAEGDRGGGEGGGRGCGRPRVEKEVGGYAGL
jgi:hypothetical protein